MSETPVPENKPRIGELLIDEAVITESQLRHALERQKVRGGKLAENLIQLNIIDEDALSRFMAERPGFKSVDLSNCKLSRELCDLIPEEFAIEQQLFPIDKMGKTITVAMAVPIDSRSIDAIREMTGLRVQPFYCDLGAVDEAIQKYYKSFEEHSWTELLSTIPKSRVREIAGPKSSNDIIEGDPNDAQR